MRGGFILILTALLCSATLAVAFEHPGRHYDASGRYVGRTEADTITMLPVATPEKPIQKGVVMMLPDAISVARLLTDVTTMPRDAIRVGLIRPDDAMMTRDAT